MKTNVIILGAWLCQAAAIGQLMTGFTGGDDLAVGPGTAGYSFTVGTEAVTIGALGIWDAFGDGLTASHAVGIWDENASLLASTTVAATGAEQVGEFFYAPINLLRLESGRTYRIAAQYTDVDFDLAKGNASEVKMQGVTYSHGYLSSGIGFEFPDVQVPGGDKGFFGPNALMAVPEPAATGVAVAGVLGVIAGGRWVRKFMRRRS